MSHKPGKYIKIILQLVWVVAYRVTIFAVACWSALIIRYAPILPVEWRITATTLFLSIYLVSLFKPKPLRLLTYIAVIVIYISWARIQPTNTADWQSDVALLPYVEEAGDDLTFHNVRDFNYRTETDYDVRYSTKKVKLSELSSVDLFTSYWDGKNLAHIILSFGFADRDYIAFSIEARKTKQQSYSTVDGFFRNFHLIYIVAEERDLIALRTKIRQPNEQVYLYRGRLNRSKNTMLLKTYIKNINALITQPAFYNTLTTNCTTQVLHNAQVGNPLLRYDWRIFLSGHVPEYLYDIGNLDNTNYTLEQITEMGYVNPKTSDLSDARTFSANIRKGVPRPEAIEK